MRFGLIFMVLILLLGFTPAARACVMLETASPRVGSTVAAPVGNVTLTFSDKVYPDHSEIAVTDAAGKRVDDGHVAQPAGQQDIASTGLHDLPPGTYKVTWKVACDCGADNPGSYKFTVK